MQVSLPTRTALIKCKEEKVFVFEFTNREMYSTKSVPDENNENRRIRKEYVQKEMWENYGKPVEEYEAGLLGTLEEVPDDYVVFTRYQNASKKGLSLQEMRKIDENVDMPQYYKYIYPNEPLYKKIKEWEKVHSLEFKKNK